MSRWLIILGFAAVLALCLWSWIELNIECEQKVCPNGTQPHIAEALYSLKAYECVCEAN